MSSVSSQVPKGVRGGGGVIRLFAGAQGGEGGCHPSLRRRPRGWGGGVSSVSSQVPKGVSGGCHPSLRRRPRGWGGGGLREERKKDEISNYPQVNCCMNECLVSHQTCEIHRTFHWSRILISCISNPSLEGLLLFIVIIICSFEMWAWKYFWQAFFKAFFWHLHKLRLKL